ncbi:ATP-dependent zinc protease [Candidatus Saccharibacteria bacterium]|nr:ATP-dependent zinc protease [Candidatus Saccharibacteria bacterium]
MASPKTLIGRVEKIHLPVLGVKYVPAKIDTGADFSAIWASRLVEKADGLHVVFFGKSSSFYSGEAVVFAKNEYEQTIISNSFGHRQKRYKIKLKVKVKGRQIISGFTLADRSQKLYPILLGRSILRGKFLVDVAKGSPMHLEEKDRKLEMIEELTLIGKAVKK